MRKTPAIRHLEAQEGKTIQQIIAESYRKHQSIEGVANELGYDIASISRWITQFDGRIEKTIVFPTR